MGPLSIFSRAETCFSKFSLSPKGPPSIFFDYLQQTGVSQTQSVSLFTFLHYETVSKFSFSIPIYTHNNVFQYYDKF